MHQQAVATNITGSIKSLHALGRNDLYDKLCSYEAFQSAANAAERRLIISMASLERGFDASYNDESGTVEVDVDEVSKDVAATLFACGARPIYTLMPIWAFEDVETFYKALNKLDGELSNSQK